MATCPNCDKKLTPKWLKEVMDDLRRAHSPYEFKPRCDLCGKEITSGIDLGIYYIISKNGDREMIGAK